MPEQNSPGQDNPWEEGLKGIDFSKLDTIKKPDGTSQLDEVWGEALSDIDFSGLGKGKEGEYPQISGEEIDQAKEESPLKGDLMELANATLDIARAQAEGKKEREVKFHESGWSLTLETPKGMVGLWSCWLNNGFFLGYPKTENPASRIDVPEVLIMKTLGVELAQPVVHYYNGKREERLWARFYGPREKQFGRVWIDKGDDHSNGFSFSYIDNNGEFAELYYGHSLSMGISTYPSNFFSYEEPDGPNATEEAVQKYRDKFLRLAVEIGFIMGGIQAVDIDLGFSMVPEDFYKENYKNITWLKGQRGKRQGWGHELIRAQKGDATVILKSGNSLVPWSTIMRTETKNMKSPEHAVGFIKDAILTF